MCTNHQNYCCTIIIRCSAVLMYSNIYIFIYQNGRAQKENKYKHTNNVYSVDQITCRLCPVWAKFEVCPLKQRDIKSLNFVVNRLFSSWGYLFARRTKRFVDKNWKQSERIVLREIHLRTTGRHLSMGSHSVICYPTEVTSPQPGRLVLDLSTP